MYIALVVIREHLTFLFSFLLSIFQYSIFYSPLLYALFPYLFSRLFFILLQEKLRYCLNYVNQVRTYLQLCQPSSCEKEQEGPLTLFNFINNFHFSEYFLANNSGSLVTVKWRQEILDTFSEEMGLLNVHIPQISWIVCGIVNLKPVR